MPKADAFGTEKEKEEKKLETAQALIDIYGSKEEADYATGIIEQINNDLELRETASLVFNGVPYSRGYEYNQQKAINYAPPKNRKDDREVTLGIVHEKIISFVAMFLKYVFRRRIKCYDEKGRLVKGMGKIYDLAIEFSYKLEKMVKKIALIYYEVYTQGNAFVLEDWEVKNQENPKAFLMKDGKKVLVTPDNMDYTYEFLDGLEYEKGEERQYRRAVSVVLDGRAVIFGNPEIEELQEQPRIVLEEEVSKADAEAMFGSLKRYAKVPSVREKITALFNENITLFSEGHFREIDKKFIVHRHFDKENNRFNIFLNGIMLLPRKTPMTLFYPRGNYPISNIPAERLRGSIYARSVPAKTKFNADFVDWALKMLANKFEQGVDPAILAKGKYTLTRDMFRGGQVTHGVSRSDYEKADPDNKGITNQETGFVQMLKDIIESQTTNPTTAGELTPNATATEISVVESNQRDKLGGLLDGLIIGFMDMAERRAETVEAKYTIKQRETLVDGKLIPVYQNFTVNVAGIENVVTFDEQVGSEGYDEEGTRASLFKQSFESKKEGSPTEFFLANPKALRDKKYHLDIEIIPERIKDSRLRLVELWEDLTQRLNIFGQDNNLEEMKKEYLEITGKPDEIFTTRLYREAEEAFGERMASPKVNQQKLKPREMAVAQ